MSVTGAASPSKRIWPSSGVSLVVISYEVGDGASWPQWLPADLVGRAIVFRDGPKRLQTRRRGHRR